MQPLRCHFGEVRVGSNQTIQSIVQQPCMTKNVENKWTGGGGDVHKESIDELFPGRDGPSKAL